MSAAGTQKTETTNSSDNIEKDNLIMLLMESTIEVCIYCHEYKLRE